MSIQKVLNDYGILGTQLLVNAVRPLSATGETEDSLGYEVKSNALGDTLILFARKYFETLETGRGPRQSSQDSGFKDRMLEYIKAKGIGADLDEKKREQLAKFLTWKINKEGDATYKKGGRQVYSNELEKFVEELKEALKKDFVLSYRAAIKTSFSVNSPSTPPVV